MKTQLKTSIFAIIISIFTFSSFGQVPVQWMRTLQLEGSWSGPSTLTLSGQSYQVNYKTKFKTAIDDGAMTMDEGFKDATLGELKGVNLIGLNSTDGLIHWSSVDNFGTAHEHIGSWSSPTQFHMEHHSLAGSQNFSEYIDVTLHSNNKKVDLVLIATLDADTVETLYGTLSRNHSNHRMSNNENIPVEVNIFPNPSDGNITIESEGTISNVRITTETGQLIYEGNPNMEDFSWKVEKQGLYLVEVMVGKETVTKKILVE